jgi:hypothetical protein
MNTTFIQITDQSGRVTYINVNAIRQIVPAPASATERAGTQIYLSVSPPITEFDTRDIGTFITALSTAATIIPTT